jgi:UDP-N-acetylmuramoylalanine--D-glutamate ligase
VGTIAGRTFYNDSLATTPESVIVALEAFSKPVVLLVGGYDKQIDLAPLAEAVARKVKAAALMGQTADALGCLMESHPASDRLPMHECQSFDEAFGWAVDQSEPGDIVLLSPGCASYDWFRNYAERGRRFIELIQAWRPAMAEG